MNFFSLARRFSFAVIAVILFIYLFVFQLAAIWPFTIDDMYIPLRYAKHWAMGHGLLWNIGEAPVEGYSNFSFVLLARLAILFKLSPVVVLKSAGIGGLFATCVALYALGRFWFKPKLAIIPCFCLLAYVGQMVWAVSGLETTVYQACIAGSVVFIFRGLGYGFFPYPRQAPRYFTFMMAGLLLVFAGLTRPEAPVLMVLFAALLVKALTQLSARVRALCYFSLPIILLFVPYFIWRWHYFGYLFPNSIYCKALIKNALFYLDKDYLRLLGPFALLALFARRGNPDARFPFLYLPSVFYLLLLVMAHPVSVYYNRLFLAAWTLLLPMAFLGLYLLMMGGFSSGARASLLDLQHDRQQSYIKLYAAFLVLVVAWVPMQSLMAYRYSTINLVNGVKLRVAIATWLNQNSKKGRVVLGDCGLIPYFAPNVLFIDAYCLNNAEMTKGSSTPRFEDWCENILKTKPEVVILYHTVQNEPQSLYYFVDLCLAKQLTQHKDYRMTRFIQKGLQSTLEYDVYTATQ